MNPARRRTLKAAAALALTPHLVRAQAARVPSALGYLPWWMAPGWRELRLDGFERLVLFDAPIGPDGTLERRAWRDIAPGLAEHARSRGFGLELALTLMEEGDFERVFARASARERLLVECARHLEDPMLAGLHLDIEGYSHASATAIAGFRASLAALHESALAKGKTLSAFFPATDDFRAYDARAASRLAWWVAQLYDAHWAESQVTGPLVTRKDANAVGIARSLARLAALGVPRSRTLLSVPLYGWQWPAASERPGAAALGKARLLTYAETPAALMPNDRLAASALARAHGVRRDPERSPYYAYREDGQWVQGWYEDLESLEHKFVSERLRGYAGLAFFPLGYDGGEIVEPLLRWWRAPAA
ncbi:MAG: glycosyl hydrolase family 18 protein [Burkholderiales bacterium]